MPKSWMKEHEAVKVRIVWVEMAGLVQRMIILDEGADLQRIGQTIFHYGPERVFWCPRWKWELRISIRHTLRTNEYQMESNSWEQVSQLHPNLSWKR